MRKSDMIWYGLAGLKILAILVVWTIVYRWLYDIANFQLGMPWADHYETLWSRVLQAVLSGFIVLLFWNRWVGRRKNGS